MTLRIGFLPSDFHPMVLMLGDAEAFHALAAVLRGFARAPADVALHDLPICQARHPLLLTHGAPEGVFAGGGGYLWRLSPARAEAFADLAEHLAEPGRLAGSEMLECSVSDAVPVKLSRGEYTDDFLLPAA